MAGNSTYKLRRIPLTQLKHPALPSRALPSPLLKKCCQCGVNIARVSNQKVCP